MEMLAVVIAAVVMAIEAVPALLKNRGLSLKVDLRSGSSYENDTTAGDF